jgi:asparagine synthase (glutamine-hydrolysing)
MEDIFCLLNSHHEQNDFYKTEFFKGKNINKNKTHSQFIEKYDEIFGYHSSGLPSSKDYFIIDDILLLCCGEIYNYKQLFDDIKVVAKTSWSCEIIIHLYLKFGFPHVLNHLDGIFAFVLYDMRMTGKNKIFVARDTLGVCPLYQIQTMYEKYFYGFSSNIKSIKNIEDTHKENNVDNEYFSDSSSEDPSIKRVVSFPPGTYSYYTLSYGNSKSINWRWTLKKSNVSYMNMGQGHHQHPFCLPSHIEDILSRAIHKRCILSTNKNIACILSGEKYGNILAYFVRNYCLENDCVFHTFSIGIKEESDMHLKHTKMVANFFESEHTEVIITKEEIFDVTPEVIDTIETCNNPEIICSYLLGKYISKNNDNIKTIFTDNGFDCLFESESIKNESNTEIESKINIAKKLKNIHFFKEKCLSLHGLEPKTPFLDNEIIQFVLASPTKSNEEMQRFLLMLPEQFRL